MDLHEQPAGAEPSAQAPVDVPRLGLIERAVAIYTRPAQAWTGLSVQVQWWFPMIIVAIVAMTFAAVLHHRALVPMMSDAWREKVASGELPAEQAQKMETFFSSSTGLIITIVQQLIILPLIALLTALLVWFGVGFILGRRTGYRMSLEVACWSALIYIPTQILTGVVAWSRESMKGVHVGFGLLLPESDTPSRLGIWLGAVLDAIGPLSIWYVIVLVLGAAAISGAPRKQVAWVIGGLYLAMVLLFSTLGAMFAPVS